MTVHKQKLAGDIAVRLGIISQLYTTRMNKLLSKYGFTLSQISVLSHCSRDGGQSWTVSSLAEVMEINQPGITKIVQKLIDKGFLTVVKSEADSRKKYLQITAQGLDKLQAVYKEMEPDIDAWFDEWDFDAMKQFKSHLDTLNRWLDGNREGVQ